MKQRLDRHLVVEGLATTRSQAQLLIKEGHVKVAGKVITKAGFELKEGQKVVVEIDDTFVGRGANKIKAAVEVFKIEVKGKVIADCGASTGGFTDYLLRQGAIKSYCIDVGHDQLAPELLKDERVMNMEKINLRHPLTLPEKVDLAVADLSFISLRLVLPTIHSLLKEGGEMILLFKPQFEVGKDKVGRNGVVKNPRDRKRALDQFLDWCRTQELKVLGVMESPIVGKVGNREFLVWMRKD